MGSALLFVVQPMFAKMVLPSLGGTPATWITCMLFFQAALLAGYAYSHWSTRWLGPRRQAGTHLLALLVPLVSLPIGLPRDLGSPVERPLWWLLGALTVAVGLPFLAVSTTAPLLQRWFAGTAHAQARDPYFLYRASNLGSAVALLGYPALVEPNLTLGVQGRWWAWGYGLLMVLVLGCAVALWRTPAGRGQLPRAAADRPERAPPAPTEPLTARRRLRWVAWAFLPSSLMLGVTTYITTDIAAVPLLWVVPLALYLLTFVVAFSRSSLPWFWLMVILQPLVLLELVFLLLVGVTEPVGLLLALHLVALAVTGLVCHGQLARDRPPTRHLTEFYLWVAVGGALGGVFNGLLAPVVFDSVVEYPLAIVLACFLRPAPAEDDPDDEPSRSSRRLDIDLPLALGTLTLVALWVAHALGVGRVTARAAVFGAALLACLFFAGRRVRLGLAVAAVVLVGTLPIAEQTDTLYRDRTFFGVVHVVEDEGGYHRLIHGNITHGAQSTDPKRRREPLTYFHRTGPIGQALTELPGHLRDRVALVGLGAGSLACYGEAGQRWTFYEIDPAVERVARDPRLFTYLRDCPPATDVVLGDARLSLERAPDRAFGVVVIDAFTSDAIPVHLITRQALDLYLDKLVDGGVLAVHITNRYVDLRPVLADLARDAGLSGLVRRDVAVTTEEQDAGKSGSVWVLMARRPADLDPMNGDRRWEPLAGGREGRVWTDDFSNVVSVLDWG